MPQTTHIKLFTILLFFGKLDMAKAQKQVPIFNPELRFIHHRENWKGNPTFKGRYVNHEFPQMNGFKDVLKWKRNKNPYEEMKRLDTFQMPVKLDSAIFHKSEDGIFWLGHATFLIRFGGKQFITDPVFKNAAVVKRHSKLPVKIKELPHTDVLLMSHDHRDHCDKVSLRKIKKLNPHIQFFSGLNMEKILHKYLRKSPGQTAGWYQQYNTQGMGFNLYFLPTRHWSKRGLLDTNKRLWGSFILEIDGKTIYFGGDSGYGSHYKEIASLFPNIDYAILGIGAYEPEWFMESNHSSPAKSYQAFLDLNAKHLIPMHYGTFDLSDEPIGYPVQVLEEIKKREGDSRIVIPSLGENLFQSNMD